MSWLSETPPPRQTGTSASAAQDGALQGAFITAEPNVVIETFRVKQLTRIGALTSAIGTILLAAGVYKFLAGVRVIGWVAGWSRLFPRWTGAVAVLGSVMLTVGIIVLIVALVKAIKKPLPATLLASVVVGSLLIVLLSVSTGKAALIRNTAAESQALITQLQDEALSIPEDKIRRATDILESLGVTVPMGSELLELLSPGSH